MNKYVIHILMNGKKGFVRKHYGRHYFDFTAAASEAAVYTEEKAKQISNKIDQLFPQCCPKPVYLEEKVV